MSITLTYASTTLNLPADLMWADEFAWKQVDQVTTHTITGALVLEAYARQTGRPITLRGGLDYQWITRGNLQTLRAWAAVPARTMQLVLRGEAARTVAFDHAAGAIEAQPVFEVSDVADGDQYAVTLRFIEV